MREGLMDDVGYHGFDDAEEMFEKYCSRCVHLPLETNEKGELWAGDCDKCSAKMEYFEEVEEDAE